MNHGFKYMTIGLIALGTACTSFAANITVNWGAQVNTYLALSNGTYIPTADSATLQIGTFASTPTDGNSNVVGFTAFASGTLSSEGAFSISSTFDEAGFSHSQIYLVVDDGSQRGIFYIDMANNTRWMFPAGTDFPNDTSIEIEDLVNNPAASPTLKTGAHVVFGSMVFDTAGYTQLRLASLVPPAPPASDFVAVAGAYSGLVQSNTPSPQTSGIINITMTDTGSFSASLTFGGARLAFRGQFDDSGDYSTSLVTKLGLTLSINLHAESVNGTDRITGTVSSGSFTSNLTANRSVFNAASNPATQFQGYYTLLVQPDSAGTDFPQGNGYGILTVDAGGTLKLKGVLGDGTKIKQTAVISGDGSWPVYIPVSKTGLLSGWVTFTNIVGASDLNGTLTWTKPPSTKLYPNGFAGTVTVQGARYNAPAPGTPALIVSNVLCNVLFTAGNGNLSSIVSNSVTLDVANKVTPCVADKSKFKVTAATGLFSGSFPNPVTGKSAKFRGALLQTQNRGAGFFIGVDQSGFVTLAPAP